MKFLYIFIFIMQTSFLLAVSEAVETAYFQTKEDISQATKKLNNLRENIYKQKAPLTEKIYQLEKKIQQQITKKNNLKKIKNNQNQILQNLEKQIHTTSEELNLIEHTLQEYRKNLIKRVSIAKISLLNKKLENLDQISEEKSPENLTKYAKKLIKFSIQRNFSLIGGKKYEGECLDSKGNLLSGWFFQIGPISYFISKNKASGITGISENSFFAEIKQEIPEKTISSLFAGKETVLPIDFSKGKSFKVKTNKKNITSHIRAGGIIMIPIMLLGVIALIISIWKFFHLQKLNTVKHADIQLILKKIHNEQNSEALNLALKLEEPFSSFIKEGINHQSIKLELLEELMHEKIILHIPYLEKGLAFLSVTAASAPLLGLLGTVTGMIETFNIITIFGTSKASLLSKGISEALITTEFGLIIAIPSLLLHAYFSKQVKNIIHSMEQTTITFINGIKIKTTKT